MQSGILKLLYHKSHKNNMPPERIELSTPGLRDQCSTTELKRRLQGVAPDCRHRSYCIEGQRGRVV